MYAYKKQTNLSFEDANQKIREELTKEGFGILTEIDVQATLKKKLGIDYNKYLILGACNPPFAHKALLAEKDIGLLLPCNVILYEEKGIVVVAVILPTIAMGMVDNQELQTIAHEIETKLKTVIDNLEAKS